MQIYTFAEKNGEDGDSDSKCCYVFRAKNWS
jgi:hypothetical protein